MSDGGTRRPRVGSGKDIDHVLLALQSDDLAWLAHPDRLFSWVAQCPFCRLTEKTLRIWIDNDDWLDDWDFVQTGTLYVGCSKRCRKPGVIMAYLMRSARVIRYERRITVLNSRLRWWIEFAKSLNESAMRRDGET